MFYREAFCDDQHLEMLDENYFPIVGAMVRHPRYVNRRILDPFVKSYVDENNIENLTNWRLPVPNAKAAYKSLAKYGKDILPLSEAEVSDMNLAWEWTATHFYLYMKDSKILDYEEAKSHLDFSSSPGAPFTTLFSTKTELFESDPDIDEWLQKDWEEMAEDDLWTCLFTNSLKEEMRPLEKFLDNSIRTFLSGGIDAVVHGTRLFVDMNEKMYASHLRTSSAVGMSPLKGNWNRLFEKLNIFKNGYALDESQYDSSLRAFMMFGCARLRWSMLADEFKTSANFKRILVYYRNLVYTVIVCPDGNLVMKKTGNPSGSVNTISDNTLILYTYLAYAWCRNCPAEFKTLRCFEAHTAKALVGDDNTWTVSDDAHVFFNARSIIATWQKLGVTTTTDSLEARRAVDLDFLSAHTTFIKGVAVPIYDRDKLLASLMHSPKKGLTPAITLERTAGMLLIGWTDLPFRKFCRNFIDWLMEKYDHTLWNDPRWLLAKTQIKSDAAYEALFLGDGVIRPQCILGNIEEAMPRNTMSKPQTNNGGRKPRRKNQNGTKSATTQTKKTVVKSATAKQAVVQIRQQQQQRAQKKMKRLSPNAVNFFTAAIDPMHDTNVTSVGWPDRNIEQSVIRKRRITMSIAKPAGNANFPAGANWDCHIIMNPWFNPMLFHLRDRTNNNITGITIGDQCVIGGVQAYATAVGANFGYGSENAVGSTTPQIGELLFDPTITVGVGRLIGIGLEVINATSPLNQQGMIYSWRAPEPENHPETWYQTAISGTIVYLQNAFSAQIFRHPPRNLDEAEQYTGTQKWHAKEGTYMVGTFNDYNNPAKMVSYEEPIIIENQDTEDSTYDINQPTLTNNTQVWAPDAVDDPDVPGATFGLPGTKLYPINQMGCILAGLSEETSLTVEMVYYYESFPSLAQTDLLSLAKPSTKYDAVVLELLAETMRCLPPAVMSKENAAGDWWDRVLQAVQIVGPGLMALVPGGEVLAPGTLAAVSALRSYRND